MPEDLHHLIHRALATLPDPPAEPLQIRQVSGGSINQTFQLSTKDTKRWFCKFNDSAKYPALFVAESKGLTLLATHSAFRVPLTYACTVVDERQVLILEWIDQAAPEPHFWTLFGEQLAALHHQTMPAFGLDHDNYMGSLPQENTFSKSWTELFIHHRLEPQIRLASAGNLLPGKAREKFERLYLRLPTIFPSEPPALLHGDLWSGNFLCDTRQRPVLIDPAVYYGHRSVDLAMTTLFGGFEPAFYDAYAWHYPLPSNYREQWSIANLYPLLIHLNLFGQSYLPNILNTIQSF